MSQDSSVSEPPNSQSTEGGTSVPAPTSQWTLWSRGINSKVRTPRLFSLPTEYEPNFTGRLELHPQIRRWHRMLSLHKQVRSCLIPFLREVNEWCGLFRDGSHYMRHRDGSGTYIPTEGTYIPRGGRDPTSKLPVLTMEEIIEEHEEVKKEHREYLAHPVKYWNGSPENRITRAWVFPTYFFPF